MLDREKLIDDLLANICKVTFTKADQSKRVMICTLRPSDLPVMQLTEAEAIKASKTPTRKFNPTVISAFDIEKREWRSFKVSQVITFERLEL